MNIMSHDNTCVDNYQQLSFSSFPLANISMHQIIFTTKWKGYQAAYCEKENKSHYKYKWKRDSWDSCNVYNSGCKVGKQRLLSSKSASCLSNALEKIAKINK